MKHRLQSNSRTVNHAEDNKLYIYLNCVFYFLLKNRSSEPAALRCTIYAGGLGRVCK